jgi:hypothetical protein
VCERERETHSETVFRLRRKKRSKRNPKEIKWRRRWKWMRISRPLHQLIRTRAVVRHRSQSQLLMEQKARSQSLTMLTMGR